MEVLGILVFASVGAAVLAVGSLPSRAPVKRRLARLADGTAGVLDVPASGSLDGEPRSPLGRALAGLARRAGGGAARATSPLRSRLVQAGFRRPNAVLVYQGTRIVLALTLPVLVLAASSMWRLEETQLLTLLGGSVALGYVAPSQFVDRRRASRQRAIVRGMPDALDLMVVCVEAGLGINASLARIAREFARTNPVLAAEFELVTLEIRAGKSSTQALRSLARRSGVTEVAALVAMLVQTERFGTSLADTLRVHADGMRIQRMLRAEEQAGKAPLKMMFPTLLIFAATLLVTLGPGLLQLIGFFSETQ